MSLSVRLRFTRGFLASSALVALAGCNVILGYESDYATTPAEGPGATVCTAPLTGVERCTAGAQERCDGTTWVKTGATCGGAGAAGAGAGGADGGGASGASNGGAGGDVAAGAAGQGGADVGGSAGQAGAGGTAGNAGSAGSANGGSAGTAGGATTKGVNGPVGSCGNGVCEPEEACGTCAGDCGVCPGGKVYYVSSSTGLDANLGDTEAEPWKTLDRVRSAGSGASPLLKPGDSVLFKKGDVFVGTLEWNNFFGGAKAVSGTTGKPITLASYGKGEKPKLRYPAIGVGSPPVEDRRLLAFFGVDYLVIDGLAFDDPTFDLADHGKPANLGVPIQLGLYGEAFAKHCVVQNVTISNAGMGIVVTGNENLIDHNEIGPLGNLVDTPCPGGGSCEGDDYGANGVTLSGNDNIVTNNVFVGNYAHSNDFGLNGGAISAFSDQTGLHRNLIAYNLMFDNDAGMKVASGGNEVRDNVFAYNLMIDNGVAISARCTGLDPVDGTAISFFNNTVVETPKSRYAGESNQILAAAGPIKAARAFVITNNVFSLADKDKVVSPNAPPAKFPHENNVLRFEGTAAAGFEPGGGDVSIAGPLFVSTTASSPRDWDFQLLPGSPAHGKGKDLKLTRDLVGRIPGNPPDPGAVESP